MLLAIGASRPLNAHPLWLLLRACGNTCTSAIMIELMLTLSYRDAQIPAGELKLSFGVRAAL